MSQEHGRKRSGRRTARLLTGAALALATTVGAAGAAGAAAPNADRSAAGYLSASHAAPATVVSPAVATTSFTHTSTTAPYYTITCTLTASDPLRYYGGAYPGGGVEAIGSVQCNNLVNTIAVQVALVKNSSVVARSTVRYSYSTNLGGQTTDTPHGAGTYITAAVTGITFPDGYYWASPEVDSPSLYIAS
ncbi:hypothetical protein RVR_1718 [Actinacidiphila reveromycinica]|uniref:Tat pathway signal sequence domain protein n=1 Tax=Actinacidiphila reveromycinica TaxID=659352 RepID=A0A7U3UPQ1_9ACTN|nr:hypothetical protein [Streptomyces sp. SN-593]BBA96426.1 hypothetical protein RVR_1718 [Streptomyces sp. SN-593]